MSSGKLQPSCLGLNVLMNNYSALFHMDKSAYALRYIQSWFHSSVSKRGHKRNKLKKNLKSNIILQNKFVDPFWGWLKLLSPKPMMPNKKVITGWQGYPSVNYATIGSDNGLSPGQCQVIIWTNAGILLIGPLGTNFGEILIEIHTFSFKKMHLKISSAKWRPFCLGLNVLTYLQKSSNDENPEDWEQAEKTQRTHDIKSFN